MENSLQEMRTIEDGGLTNHTQYHRDRKDGIETYEYNDQGERRMRRCENCGTRIKMRGFAKKCRYCDPVNRLGYTNTQAQRWGADKKRDQALSDRVVP